jgi:hypothetical protein
MPVIEIVCRECGTPFEPGREAIVAGSWRTCPACQPQRSDERVLPRGAGMSDSHERRGERRDQRRPCTEGSLAIQRPLADVPRRAKGTTAKTRQRVQRSLDASAEVAVSRDRH